MHRGKQVRLPYDNKICVTCRGKLRFSEDEITKRAKYMSTAVSLTAGKMRDNVDSWDESRDDSTAVIINVIYI